MDAKIAICLILSYLACLGSAFSYCGENERLNSCGHGACQATCDHPYINCPDVCSGDSCDCIGGYVRHEGKCIKYEDCPKRVCGPNEVFKECASVCQEECKPSRRTICPTLCTVPGCYCIDGYVRDDNRKCIRKEDCPPEYLTGRNL